LKEKDEIMLMPKRNPTPVVSLFIGARSWQGEGIPYGDITEPLKSRVDEFLEKTRAKLKKITSSKPACLSSEANHTAGRKEKREN